MTQELKPCPFCGGEARTASDATGFLQWVYCPECGGQTGYFTGNADGIKKLVIDAWNTRAERTCTPVDNGGYGFRFECSGCGYVAIVHNCAVRLDELPNFCPNCGAKVVSE